MVPDRLPNYYNDEISHCLKKAIIDSKEDWECNEKPMNIGMISSQSLQ